MSWRLDLRFLFFLLVLFFEQIYGEPRRKGKVSVNENVSAGNISESGIGENRKGKLCEFFKK